MRRRRGPPRPIALAAAVVGVLAAGSAGCGREGELVQTRAGTPAPTATTQGAPPTGTTPRTRTPRTKRPRARTTTTQRSPGRTTTSPATPTTPTTTTGRDGPVLSDWRLRRIAAAFARREFRVETRTEQAKLRRSRSKPRWAVVSGEGGRTLWAVWLRDGAVVLAARDEARLHQPSVPCDVRLPLTKRSC